MLYYSSQTNYGVCLYNMGPSYTEQHKELEMVQRRTTRFVTGDYRTTSSVTQMIEALQQTELKQRRKRAKVIMLYRIVNHLLAISPQQYLIIPRGVALTTRGHDTRFLLPYSSIQNHQQSFFPSAIRLWNELPTAVVTASTLEGFKDSLQTVAIYQTCRFNCIYRYDGF